ncbi:hypothetical protein HHI36_003693 [Cryptolaemus montrouzieri]|uniref:PIF1/LRR1 pleckstrin homology domain-containing protein n=1 Tax=Cryptolaemus montrouzieri TaxID=559131 RepID=A0ABD2PE62_9CUCU
MKLVCTVTVGNRLLPIHAMKSKKKSSKSTVALCKHPKSDSYYLILFSGQDKTGIKYDLKHSNIEKVLTKFVAEGKTTIQFKSPPHDIFIQAEVLPLKCFLHLLQRILKGTISPKELSCSSLGVTPVQSKDIAPTKLVIQSRSEYPPKGFPRTLESLSIVNIRRASLDLGILRLTKLRDLNLSENCLTTLPSEFSQMSNLQSLDISNNEFHKSSRKNWDWLGGNLSKTLQSLILSNNELSFLPEHLIKLQNLNLLNVNHNRLENIPNGIGRLIKLKELRISHNLLKELPGSIQCLNLQVLDISNNRFQDAPQELPGCLAPTLLSVCTLKEYAAQRVLDLNLLYNSEIIPATLVTYLNQEAKYCVCGRACFSVYFHRNLTLNLRHIAKDVIMSGNHYNLYSVPINCVFCCLACLKVRKRDRVNLVR